VLGFLRNKVPQIIRTYNQNIQYQITGKEIVISSYSSVFLKVINQFIENSVRHGFDEVETPIIKISVNIKLNEIEVHYSDNGVGIEQEKRNKIFDPFYATSLSDGNLGLGLNIIYNSVVHIMHGQVECLGDDEGAHFLIVLPKNTSSETLE
jgi:K+-sensing histidine kinase KdpD